MRKKEWDVKKFLLTNSFCPRKIKGIEKGDEKEEYTPAPRRERNPLAARFLGKSDVEGGF